MLFAIIQGQSSIGSQGQSSIGRLSTVSLVSLMFLLGGMGVFAQDHDADQDRIVDTVDIDDDNDGIPDIFEINSDGSDRDSDGDGTADRHDLDSDNDGILDLIESGWPQTPGIAVVPIVGGRIFAKVGLNGLADFLETALDNGQLVYRPVNTDNADGDVVPDFLDLDSDNDGLPDLVEAGVPENLDQDRNGRIDAAPSAVGADGILDLVQSQVDISCCDYTQNGIQDDVPRNTDVGDLPDFQDPDSDNDGVFDLVEAGGQDADTDGRIDGFRDGSSAPDGIDDSVLIAPLPRPDRDGDGVPDYLDPAVQFGVPDSAAPVDTPVESPVDMPVVPESEPQAPDAPVSPTINGPADDGSGGTPADDGNLVGDIETGLQGGGCTVGNSQTSIDPVLPGLLFFAITYICGWRKYQRWPRRNMRYGI